MSLAAHLQRHGERLDELVDLLERERTLLADGEVDGTELGRLAERKQACLAALDDFERRRREVQRRLGYRDDREGDRRAARQAGCADLWATLQATAQRAADLNRTNGVLIGVRMESNQRLLNGLREWAGRGLYGPDGQARAGGGRVDQRA